MMGQENKRPIGFIASEDRNPEYPILVLTGPSLFEVKPDTYRKTEDGGGVAVFKVPRKVAITIPSHWALGLLRGELRWELEFLGDGGRELRLAEPHDFESKVYLSITLDGDD